MKDYADFSQRNIADKGPAPRSGDHQTVALQAQQSLTHRSAAHLQFLSEILFNNALAWAQFAGMNGLAQMGFYTLAGGNPTFWFGRMSLRSSHQKWRYL